MDRTVQFQAIAKYVSEGMGLGILRCPVNVKQGSRFTQASSDIDGLMSTTQKRVIALDAATYTTMDTGGAFMSRDDEQAFGVQVGEVHRDLEHISTRIAAMVGVVQSSSFNASTLAHAIAVVDIMRRRLAEANSRYEAFVIFHTQRVSKTRSRRSLYSSSFVSSPVRPQHFLLDVLNPPTHQVVIDITEPQVSQVKMHASSNESLTRVHDTIVDIGTMLQRLSGLVAQQNDTVTRLDDYVDSTVTNIERATESVRRISALASISSSWLAVKVVGILTVCVVVMVVLV